MNIKSATVSYQTGVSIVGLPTYVTHFVPSIKKKKLHPKHQSKQQSKNITY